MSWPSEALQKGVDITFFGSMKPHEVLYEFDGPCIFTTRTKDQTLLLAYLSEELEDEHLRFIVSTTADATINAMKEGTLSVRDAIERGSLWIVDLDYHYVPKRAYAVQGTQLPDLALPAPTTMLHESP